MLTDGRTTDGRRTDDGRTDDGVTGILIAHLGAFGSGELKNNGIFIKKKYLHSVLIREIYSRRLKLWNK